MELKTISLGQRPARVWTGGTGEAIVLLHGGWAGAEAYWSTVTDDLERTHLVVAPEMPLIGSADGLPTFGAYAAWLNELLTALGIERATIVGNSLGATIAWRFAGEHPERCAGLVLVDGYQPPVYSKMLRWLATKSPMRALVRSNLLRQHYSPGVVAFAFHDRSKVPAQIVQALGTFTRADADRVLDVLLAEEAPCPPPKGSVLLIWGEADRLPVLDKHGAHKMRPSLEKSKLVTIPEAGHLPQIERPAEFLRALRGGGGPEALSPRPRRPT